MASDRVRRKVEVLSLPAIVLGLALTFVVVVLQSAPHEKRTVEERRHRRAADESGDCLHVLVALPEVRTLISPNYPDLYPSNADCRWLLTTRAENETITIRIGTLAIELEHECRLDFLRVHLGPSLDSPLLLPPLCGRVEDRLVPTNSSSLLLEFRSDSTYEDRGFSIDYYVVQQKEDGGKEEERGGECQREASSGEGGWLTSPRFPAYYPDDAECTTVVKVAPGRKVVLLFDTLDLEYGENCTFDYVRIYDGDTRNSTLLGHICHDSDPRRFESSSESMLVHFRSDGSVARKGFRARYSSVDRRHHPPTGDCVWETDDTNGTVTSPLYPESYPALANCSLWIVAPPTHRRITLRFDSLLLEMESNCSYDFLRITEPREDGEEAELGRFCGRLSEPRRLTSGGPELRLEFRSDDFVELLGFKLTYEFVEAEAEQNPDEDDVDDELRFTSRPRDVTLSPGSSHALQCATDHPNAKIRWLKGDLFLAGDQPLPGLKVLANDTVWIQSMGRHLAGTYSCVAVAPEGTVITATADVLSTEESNCKIGFRKVPADSDLEEGSFALLECLADSPQSVIVSWRKDGEPLPQRRVTVLKNGYAFVDSVELEDAGTYTCVARDLASGCEREASAEVTVNRRTRIEEVCGKPKFGNTAENSTQRQQGKIIGGHDAQKGAYPWQVMLWDPRWKSFCGAVLLNERWIATAAHCLARESRIPLRTIRILLGKHDRESREPEEVETRIADVVRHPLFDQRTYDNDLALVRMRHRVEFTDYIMPVCLGTRELSESLLGTERTVIGTVVGWGQLKEKGPSPRFLQEIKVPVVEQEVCRNSTRMRVTRNMFCAGYAQEVIGDACQGDSGGPFLVRNDEGDRRWYAVGIVSWGEGCGENHKYGFYTKIANHIAWIRGVIES